MPSHKNEKITAENKKKGEKRKLLSLPDDVALTLSYCPVMLGDENKPSFSKISLK